MIKYLFLTIVFTFQLCGNLTQLSAKDLISNESVLSNGKWVKIKVANKGIQKIPYSALKTWGFNDPLQVSIFGNGGAMLPVSIADTRATDLKEISTWHHNDAMFFYAPGTTQWKYDKTNDFFKHELNQYSNASYYFLSDSNGNQLTIESINSTDQYTQETSEYDSYQFLEENTYNLLKSGKRWLGDNFNQFSNERNYSFDFPDLNISKPITAKIQVAARSRKITTFNINTNGSSDPIQILTVGEVNFNSTTDDYAKDTNKVFSLLSDKNLDISIKYNYGETTSLGWLDYICLNAKEYINLANKNQLSIRNKDVISNGSITLFKYNFETSHKIWDISNFTNPININPLSNGFTAPTESLKEFILFNTLAEFPQPTFEEFVNNQDIKNISIPDMLIVCHPDFLAQAERLKQLHHEHTGLESTILTPQTIYNEFSSGQKDLCAIRDYCKYLWDKDKKFKFLLLFGDGSYDNLSNDQSNTNKIITYQSDESYIQKFSYTSDDFFGILEDHEGNNIIDETVDIGIGRFPVNTTEEAKNIVDKIERYLTTPLKQWNTTLSFFADDEDNNTHIKQGDGLAIINSINHPEFQLQKNYFDAYPKVTLSNGMHVYPDINRRLEETVNDGALIINYTGHGSEHYLAHEKIVSTNDINKWSNYDRLPIFVTASCEFSRYDNKAGISAGEAVLLNPNGGGIALFTTTRVAWATSNYSLNTKFYNHIFLRDDNGNYLPFGEVMRRTKNASAKEVNTRNFTLLGDPALAIAAPKYRIDRTLLDGESDHNQWSPLQPLTTHTFEGTINADDTGNGFTSGTIYYKVYDKALDLKTLGNSSASPIYPFREFKRLIAEGQAEIIDGKYTFDIFIPKNISPEVDYGRIYYFATDNNENEAFEVDSIPIGIINQFTVSDTQGPAISASVTRSENSNLILNINLSDESGINSTNLGLGRNISLSINDQEKLILDNYFINSNNSYQKGTISFELPELQTGDNSLTIKAWDYCNNSNTLTIKHTIEPKEKTPRTISNLSIEKGAFNEFNISFNHNFTDSKIAVKCSLSSQDGQLVDSYYYQVPSGQYIEQLITWKTTKEIKKGIYTLDCTVAIENSDNINISKKILMYE